MGAKKGIRGAGAHTKFRLLMWKNLLQQYRHPLKTAAELLVPVLAMSIILLFRLQIQPMQRDITSFPPVEPYSLNNSMLILSAMNISDLSLAYSPESDVLEDVLTCAVTELIIRNAIDLIAVVRSRNITALPNLKPLIKENTSLISLLPNLEEDLENMNRTLIREIVRTRIKPHKSSSSLNEVYDLEDKTRTVIAAVEFDDALYGATELPSKISYALRFPKRPRHNSFFGLPFISWRTDQLFPLFELPGPRTLGPDGGGDPGYVQEMFIALQNALSTELLSRLTGEPLKAFEINLQRFPHPAYLDDIALEGLQFLLPAFLVMSFSYAALNITSAITVEKELQLKETLKIMGMPAWINWIAWFCNNFIFLFVATILITMILKINWFSNADGTYAVFTHTPWSVLFFFLVIYSTCTICFCFMMSGFFSKGSTAALATCVVWFLTFIPAFLLLMDIDVPLAVQYITCLCVNSAMAYGFTLLLTKESSGGLQWGDFLSATTVDSSRMLFGHVLLMMAVNCVIYTLIALYLEQVLPGPYGTPKPWYFLFHKDFWCPRSESIADVRSSDALQAPKVIKEQDPVGHSIGVKMTNLTKVFGKSIAVNNLNLDIYNDQITVLLGHNGAGKSTTISMLTGNLAASSGSMWVAGHDMTWSSSNARAQLGLCPQHDVIFKDLTVREHLEFFARLKGAQGKEVDHDVDSLIAKLELTEKRNCQAGSLSGGQKRRLCVGIAMSGDSRVVLLDEPSSGMDPSSRRALWDLLQKEKKGRSIILTTHFMDEADILGDRIAIMANGHLQCVGSPYFLKRHYGVGYTLVIVKDEGFNLDACTQTLMHYNSEIEIMEDRGTEVTYSLTQRQSQTFEVMLSGLENNKENIKFKNYGLLSTTMEDVFMSAGSELQTHSDHSDTTSISEKMYEEFAGGASMDRLVTEDSRGFRLLGQHILAVWLKLCLVYSRSWSLILMQVLVPIIIIVGTLLLMGLISNMSAVLSRLPLSLTEGFLRTESLLTYDGSDMTSLGARAAQAYEDALNAARIPTMTVARVYEPIDDFYLRKTHDIDNLHRVRHHWLTGATFSDDVSTAWFSNFGYHDIAISLAAVHNALLKARHPTAELNVYNHPLSVNYMEQSDSLKSIAIMAQQFSDGIGISLGISSAVFVIFYIKENALRAKLLQKASGIQPVVLWGAAAVFDWLWFLFISLTIVFACLGFGIIGLSTAEELGRLFLVMMLYGAAVLPLMYVASLVFKKPTIGFMVMFCVNAILGYTGGLLVSFITIFLPQGTAKDIVDNTLQFIPLYSLIASVRNLNKIGMTTHTCMQICNNFNTVTQVGECTMEYMCALADECCLRNSYFDWSYPGIAKYLCALTVTCVVMWIILMIVEYDVWHKIYRRNKTPPPIDPSTVDSDVLAEEQHADISRRAAHYNLVATKLSKYYGKHLAVDQVSFSVSGSECFGLLGINGAGKTTTFKMLMGDETVSSGDAYIGGYSVRRNINRVHETIGYCPQFDALFGELTGRETLLLYSLLRGFSFKYASAKTATLAGALGFTKHLNKRVKQYSGGNKRKLSTAVSLLGDTSLVFVDEPTTGVDPAAKRQVWRGIRDAMRQGRGVLLTSHSMEECEALCSRITIMVNGRFQCLGSPQHLKNKFSQGFTLTIRMKKDTKRPLTVDEIKQIADDVKSYVETHFETPALMEEYQGLLTYYLPNHSASWSRMFGIMESAKQILQIEDYTISQTTLEQIFLQLTKYQKTPNEK